MTAAPATRSTRTDSTTTTSTARRGSTTPQEQAARRQVQKLAEVHAQLADAVAAAATDAGWRAWLSTAAKFRSYSPTNQLLIVLQRPSATRVAGYRVWQGLGRQVRKGERGLTILAPVRRHTMPDSTTADGGPTTDGTPGGQCAGTGADEPGDGSAGGAGRVLVGFNTARVFDILQTDGQPLPELPAVRLPEGRPRPGCGTGSSSWSRPAGSP